MATKEDLKDWVVQALKAAGGQAHLVDVARHIWESHKEELAKSGTLFFTWQYDMRWAATGLRRAGLLAPADKTGFWKLTQGATKI